VFLAQARLVPCANSPIMSDAAHRVDIEVSLASRSFRRNSATPEVDTGDSDAFGLEKAS
jgi:hypothetical protein